MRILIAGGDKNYCSKIVEEIEINKYQIYKFNEYSDFKEFSKNIQLKIDEIKPHIIIWMVTSKKTIHLIKPKGSILICSQLSNYREEIHNMFATQKTISKANADGVIVLRPTEEKLYKFNLIDNLGNYWENTFDFEKIIKASVELYKTTTKINYGQTSFKPRLSIPRTTAHLHILMNIATNLAIKIGMLYDVEDLLTFDLNYTRVFPSLRERKGCFVSKHDIPSQFTEITDMVYIEKNSHASLIDKCAIDAPIHIQIYDKYPHINYIIHSHAYARGAPVSKNFHFCGDQNMIKDLKFKNKGIINLRNHGCIIYSATTKQLSNLVRDAEIIPRGMEEIKIESY